MGKRRRARQLGASIGGNGFLFGTKRAPAPIETEEEFANQFTSATLRVCVGPTRKEYHSHKNVLVARYPYFKTMLASSFISKEADENTVVMDSAVDHEDAVNMFVEFLYTSSYIPPEDLDLAATCILHSRVYVLAERLCMDDLKEMAFAQLKASLAQSYRLKPGFSSYNFGLDPTSVMDLVHIVYGNTPGRAKRRPEPNSNMTCGKSLNKDLEEGASNGAAIMEPSEGSYRVVDDVPEENLAGYVVETVADKMRVLIAQYAASLLDTLLLWIGRVSVCLLVSLADSLTVHLV